MNAKAIAKTLEEVARVERGEIHLKTAAVFPPNIDVKRLRSAIGLSQSEFAARFGFSTAAIRNWEQGLRDPEGPARTLLALIARNPKRIEREIKLLQAA